MGGRRGPKTVIVTGAGTGIGFTVALCFYLEGATWCSQAGVSKVLREAAAQIAVDPGTSPGGAGRHRQRSQRGEPHRRGGPVGCPG